MLTKQLDHTSMLFIFQRLGTLIDITAQEIWVALHINSVYHRAIVWMWN